MLDTDDVEDSNSNDRCKDKQSGLPPCRPVRLIVDGYQGLNDGADQVAVDGHDTLPRDCRKPAYETVSLWKRGIVIEHTRQIAEQLLLTAWSKLADLER